MGGMRSAWLFAGFACLCACHVVVGEAEDGGGAVSKGDQPTLKTFSGAKFSNQGLKAPRVDVSIHTYRQFRKLLYVWFRSGSCAGPCQVAVRGCNGHPQRRGSFFPSQRLS